MFLDIRFSKCVARSAVSILGSRVCCVFTPAFQRASIEYCTNSRKLRGMSSQRTSATIDATL
jgi:hypothetical protein